MGNGKLHGPAQSPEESLEVALASYLNTLLWSETLSMGEDEEGNPRTMLYEGAEFEDGTPLDQIIDRGNLPDEVIDSSREDLQGFVDSCVRELGFNPVAIFDPAQVGHNFALSRNGHGAGFFDDSYRLATWCPHASRDDRGTGCAWEVNDDLQRLAKYMGTHGLEVWVTDAGELKVGEHS